MSRLQRRLIRAIVATLRLSLTRAPLVVVVLQPSMDLTRAPLVVALQPRLARALVVALRLRLVRAPGERPHVSVVHLAHACAVMLQLSPMLRQGLRGRERGADGPRRPSGLQISERLCDACKRRSPARSTCPANR